MIRYYDSLIDDSVSIDAIDSHIFVESSINLSFMSDLLRVDLLKDIAR
jgi:hypothetical protein